MKVFYRISDSGYKKEKPEWINNENCLINFYNNFLLSDVSGLYIVADNVINVKTLELIKKIQPDETKVWMLNIGHGAGTFLTALNYVIQQIDFKDDEVIYFVENDYVHASKSKLILQEGIDIGGNYVSLYDHPYKYIESSDGGNPYVQGGGELTKVFVSPSTHWKLTNSTTMTFAATKQTLKEDYNDILPFVNGTHPMDFHMFSHLINKKNRILITPIPGYSTHGETKWLSSFKNWEVIISNTKFL